MSSFLQQLQHRIEKHINQHEALKDVPVISHRAYDVKACVDEFMHSGIGLYIVVMNPIPELIMPHNGSISFEHMQIRVQIIENPQMQSGSISALEAAEYVTAAVHNFQPQIANWSGWCEVARTNPWQEQKDPMKLGRYILELNFIAKGSYADFNEDIDYSILTTESAF